MDTIKEQQKDDYDLSLIKQEHVIAAIKEIKENGIPLNAKSSTYDLVYEKMRFPPKLVLSWAYRCATGLELDRSLFEGGQNTPCFNRLKELGFTITYKNEKQEIMESFYPVIQKFLKQADEAKSLKVSDYPKLYNGLRVTVSFGQGGFARIPWISFLYEGQTTSNGIYPVLLYFKKQQVLILSYGVSEINEPNLNWDMPDSVESIAKYFQNNNLGKPHRYGKSYVYRAYNTSITLNQQKIDKDLTEIITIYKSQMTKEIHVNHLPKIEHHNNFFTLERVKEISQTGLLFNTNLLYRYAISLLTKPFVILSGLSGSGKTKLALSFAKWLTKSSSQVKIISVGSDWNNREYLLGYPNALETGKYIKPDNGVLEFIIQAMHNPELPYFLILDEMNLSYVERYFADFLSTMESHEPITLHPDLEISDNEGGLMNVLWDDIPSTIYLPHNLYITGTINVDETTYMFSPKVLDRANVIEFRINREDMDEFLANRKPLQPDAANHLGSDMQIDFVTKSCSDAFEKENDINKILLLFFEELKKAGAEFGYRTASEIYRFIAIASELKTDWSQNQLIDYVIMQKLLPKLHGSRKKLQPILNTLWDLCQDDDRKKNSIDKEDIVFDNQYIYPVSAAKIWQMYKNAKDNGFSSYAEA